MVCLTFASVSVIAPPDTWGMRGQSIFLTFTIIKDTTLNDSLLIYMSDSIWTSGGWKGGETLHCLINDTMLLEQGKKIGLNTFYGCKLKFAISARLCSDSTNWVSDTCTVVCIRPDIDASVLGGDFGYFPHNSFLPFLAGIPSPVNIYVSNEGKTPVSFYTLFSVFRTDTNINYPIFHDSVLMSVKSGEKNAVYFKPFVPSKDLVGQKVKLKFKVLLYGDQNPFNNTMERVFAIYVSENKAYNLLSNLCILAVRDLTYSLCLQSQFYMFGNHGLSLKPEATIFYKHLYLRGYSRFGNYKASGLEKGTINDLGADVGYLWRDSRPFFMAFGALYTGPRYLFGDFRTWGSYYFDNILDIVIGYRMKLISKKNRFTLETQLGVGYRKAPYWVIMGLASFFTLGLLRIPEVENSAVNNPGLLEVKFNLGYNLNRHFALFLGIEVYGYNEWKYREIFGVGPTIRIEYNF